MQNRQILMLSYNFPPEISGGVGRPYSLYKHLPKFGFDPLVVTVKHNNVLSDERNIYRFSCLMRQDNESVFNTQLLFRIYNKFIKYLGADTTIDIYWDAVIKRNIDTIIRQNKIKVVYASFPPIQAMKLGLYISKKYNLPLISEFRDGYCFAPLYKNTRIQNYFANKLEHEIVMKSSAIITIGNNLSQYFKDSYSEKDVFTVYNGYEKSDYKHTRLGAKQKSISIDVNKMVHFGSLNLSKKRNIQPLFQALSRLKTQGLVTCNSFSLTLIGKYTSDEVNYSKIYSVEDIVAYKEPVEKTAGFTDIINNYNSLLFYGVENDPTFISAKLMEYLMLGKPIFGICQGNEAERIIQKTNTGVTCGFNEEEIYNSFVLFLRRELMFNPVLAEIKQFDREHQAEQISKIIRKVINLGQ